MTDSVADILGQRRFEEPAEVTIIKRFVREKYNADVTVAIRENQIIMTVRGAALAGTMRTHLHELKKLCRTQKRLVLRIS